MGGMSYRVPTSTDAYANAIAWGIMFVIVGLIFGAIWLLNYNKCSSRAEMMSLDYSWGPVQGCMVRTKAGWRPLEALRDIDP